MCFTSVGALSVNCGWLWSSVSFDIWVVFVCLHSWVRSWEDEGFFFSSVATPIEDLILNSLFVCPLTFKQNGPIYIYAIRIYLCSHNLLGLVIRLRRIVKCSVLNLRGNLSNSWMTRGYTSCLAYILRHHHVSKSWKGSFNFRVPLLNICIMISVLAISEEPCKEG